MRTISCVSFPAREASLNYTANCDEKFSCPRDSVLLPELMHWLNLMADLSPLANIPLYDRLGKLLALAETVCSLFHDEKL